MGQRTITLDVRDDIRNGREAFGKIMQTVAGLKDNERLLLIAPLEPLPLFEVLAQRGFSHQSRPTPSGDYEVLFTRGACGPTSTTGAGSRRAGAPTSSRL